MAVNRTRETEPMNGHPQEHPRHAAQSRAGFARGRSDSDAAQSPGVRRGECGIVAQSDRITADLTLPRSEGHYDFEDKPVVSQTARDHEQMEQVVDTEDTRPENGPAEQVEH